MIKCFRSCLIKQQKVTSGFTVKRHFISFILWRGFYTQAQTIQLRFFLKFHSQTQKSRIHLFNEMLFRTLSVFIFLNQYFTEPLYEKNSGASIISQWLVGPFLNKIELLTYVTNGPRSQCEMRIVPDFAWSPKWWDFVLFYIDYLLYRLIGCLLFLLIVKKFKNC